MHLNLSKVRFSKRDKEKGIIIPNELTKELAEDVGIHIGDGSLHKCNKWKSAYEFSYTTSKAELDYVNHIVSLKKRLYNLPYHRILDRNTWVEMKFNSLAIATFFENVFNMPVGNKCKIVDIPPIIKNCKDKQIIAACIKGIIDTDFYFGFKNQKGRLYPVITGRFASFKLVKSLSLLFKKLGINHCVQFYDKRYDKSFMRGYSIGHTIAINGFERLNLFLNIVGFSNQKNISRLNKFESGPEEIRIQGI